MSNESGQATEPQKRPRLQFLFQLGMVAATCALTWIIDHLTGIGFMPWSFVIAGLIVLAVLAAWMYFYLGMRLVRRPESNEDKSANQ